MKDAFETLKSSWQEARKDQKPLDSGAMLRIIQQNQKSSKRAHMGNILVLSATVLGLVAFFYYLAPLQEVLSRVGITLMIGGLVVRIAIEAISYRKAGQIDYSGSSKSSSEQAHAFLMYRKRIHGPVTFIIVALYTIGFYSLTPEFSTYLSTFWIWMADGSYLLIGVGLFLGIRKGVVKEMQALQQIDDLQQALHEE